MSASRHDITDPTRDKFGVPGISYPTPVIDDLIVVEEFVATNGTYKPLEYGSAHPKYKTATLISQEQVKGDETNKTVRRIYATDRVSQESYNYSIGYVCDGKAFPKLIRKKMVPRQGYLKLAEYAPDPDIASALLTSEETSRCEPEFDSLYIWVTYTYETLPGPYVPFTRYDNDLGPIAGTKRFVQKSGQASTLTVSGSVDYEARREGAEESSLVLWEKVENWTNGSGSGSNPAFPLNYSSEYNEERGTVDHVTQLVISPASNHASLAFGTGSTVVETKFSDFNNFLQKRDTSSYVVPAPIIQREIYDDEKGAVIVQTRLVGKSTQVPSLSLSGSTVTEVEYEPFNTLVYRQKTSTFTVPGPLLTRYSYDAETGMDVTTTTQIIAKPTNDSGYGEAAGVVTEYRPQNAVYGLNVITTFNNGSTSTFGRTETKDQPYSYPGLLFAITGALVEAKNGIARVVLNATRRTPRTRIVSHQIAITYGLEGNLTLPTVFDPVLASLIYDGAFFNVNERNVLNDAITIGPYTTGSDNPIWPAIVETVSFSASALSATAYNNLIGTYQIVNVVKEKWKYGLWRMAVISVPLR